MVRSVVFSLVLFTIGSTLPAQASDEVENAPSALSAPRAVLATPNVDELTTFVAPVPPSRGAALPALYISLAGLNAYDTFTTMKGVSQGAVEANGWMRGAAGSPVAMVAVKSGVTFGSILVAERLWKSGHRAQAIGMMVASNAMMVVVGARNTNVLRSQR